ncbi:MAG: glycosyltransferase family 4 protein [Candidatus Lokiarchaeia archaeon]
MKQSNKSREIIYKILQVSPYFLPYTGGSERYCQQLSKHLAERGHKLHVITSKLKADSDINEKKDGYHIHRCPCAGIIWRVNPATFIMHKLLKAKADIIHAHSYIFLTSNQAALTKKLTRIPFLLHLHGGIDFSPLTNDFSTRFKLYFKKSLYDRTLGKWTVQAADAVASVSKRDIELAKQLWDLDKEKLYWVPNAVNLDKFNRNSCNENKDPLNVVFIGRLEAWKGAITFLEVAKLVRKERDDVNFLMIGDGSLKNYILNNTVNAHVKALGQIPHTMIPNILSEASVLVLPSYIEGLPTVCLEALASKVPVVASKVGGIPEVIRDGETGFLFSSGNAHLCAKKVLRLLTDEKLRRRMGERGRKLVERFYIWDKVVEKTGRIYEKIIG